MSLEAGGGIPCRPNPAATLFVKAVSDQWPQFFGPPCAVCRCRAGDHGGWEEHSTSAHRRRGQKTPAVSQQLHACRRSEKLSSIAHHTQGKFLAIISLKDKGKGLVCYGAAYMSQTRDQQRFTISEVAADWHEPMVPQRIMWPSIARANGQLDPRCSKQTHHRPNQR